MALLTLAIFLLAGTPTPGGMTPPNAHAAPARAAYDCTTNLDLPVVECEALVALYKSTNGPGWTNSTGWLTGLHPCEWHRLFCSVGHVTQVHLSGNHLSGSIPAQIASLGHLQLLDLQENQLVGSIPHQLGNLNWLEYLLLGDNQLSGSIPAELGGLGSLRYLWLHTNQLSGSIPPQLGTLTHLRSLDLYRNQLTGGIPPELGNLTNLEYLYLPSNLLSGPVPAQLGNLAILRAIALDSNPGLAGPLPQSLTQLTLGGLFFAETGLCEPPNATFQNWLGSIPEVESTNVFCTTGGKNLTISASPLALSWEASTGQTAYILLKYNTATATPTLTNLPGNATSYADASAASGTVYCYVLAPLEPSGSVLGLSDVLCGATGLATGSVLPQGFALKLGGTANATMTWTAPVGGADSYLLQRIPLDGSPITNVALAGATTTTTQAVVAAGTCFQLVAFKGVAHGTSDVLCGVPGVSTLGTQPAAKRLQSVGETLAEVTDRLQVIAPPAVLATVTNR